MSAPGTVVVGASLAGVRTVQALRRKGYDAPIVVLGAETHLPYNRPPLSKDFLTGRIDAADLALAAPDVLAGLDIDLRLGTRATALDTERRTVTAGEQVPYETLIIATGSVPRTLPGAERLDGVFVLRTLDDATAIRRALPGAARVAVIGGGLIGAEVAWAARQLGVEVTIVDPLPTLMTRVLGARIGAVLARRHADHGVDLRLGRGVDRLVGGTHVEQVVLDDGAVVEADLVVVGIGADPAVDWLAGSGLDLAGGVRCDASLRAAPSVYAVGDVARWGTGGRSRRLEHWTNAADQAAALAATLTGSDVPYDPMPYAWSDQLGTRLQIWGEVRPDDEVRFFSGDDEADDFVAVAGGNGALHAVLAVGARREALRAARLLHSGAAWERGTGPVEGAG